MMNRLLLALVLGTFTSFLGCGSGNGGTGSAFDSGALRDAGGGARMMDARLVGDSTMKLMGSDAANHGALTITPPNPTLTVTNLASLPSQTFKTTLTSGGVTKPVTSTWSLSDYSLGSIDATGTFTPKGTIAGTLSVTASYTGLTAATTVTIIVKLTSSLGDVTLPDGTVISEDATAITPADMAALNGKPVADGGAAVSPLIYPYDGTVFPLGLVAPVAEFAAGSAPPVDFKISLDTTNFHWDGYGHVGNPLALQAAIPQSIWDGALQSTAPNSTTPGLTISLVTASAGMAYGPSQSRVIVAPGKLTGIIYYESYSSDALPDGGTDFGLWSVKPGLVTPPSHLQPGCVLCHSVSADGNTLTASTDDQNGPTTGANSGVFRIEADGGYTHLATSPTALPYTENSARGLGWATVSPDGKLVMRSVNQYWGGDTLLAWAVPAAPQMMGGVLQPLSTTVTVNGNLDMFVPEYSPDGKHLVYVTAQGGVDAGVSGTPSQSIGVLDISASLTDGGEAGTSFGTVTLVNAHTIYDSTQSGLPDGGGGNVFTKVPTFLPDSKTIVFEETQQYSAVSNGMLPDYFSNAETTYVDGELAMLQPNGSGGYVRVALGQANSGYDPAAATHNYEPKPLPVQVGGYYWVVFSSTRADAYPNLPYPKKLWVTAISPGNSGKDTSHPAFTLVNQAIVTGQKSQRAYWALAPCQGKGATCQSTNDCCSGSCLPQPGADASAPLVCGTPETSTCIPSGGHCQAGQDSQCCMAAQGVTCIGTLNGLGTCGVPAPP
jgi:hypothetical protein